MNQKNLHLRATTTPIDRKESRKNQRKREAKKRQPNQTIANHTTETASERAHMHTNTSIHVSSLSEFWPFFDIEIEHSVHCTVISLSVNTLQFNIEALKQAYKKIQKKNIAHTHIAHCSFMLFLVALLALCARRHRCWSYLYVFALCGPPISIHHGTETCHTKKLITFQCARRYFFFALSPSLCVLLSRRHSFECMYGARAFCAQSANHAAWIVVCTLGIESMIIVLVFNDAHLLFVCSWLFWYLFR